MFVILETGSKQYRVSEGNKIDVEKIEGEKGDKVVLNDVLFLQQDDGKILVGQPKLENITVEAEIVEQYKDEKVLSFKKRRRKNSERIRGHRQQKTALKILNIKIA